MTRHHLTDREVDILVGLSGESLSWWIRRLSARGVTHRQIGQVIGRSESWVSDHAVRYTPPLAGQVVPEEISARLRQLRAADDPRFDHVLAAHHTDGWSYAALGRALNISGQAVWARCQRHWQKQSEALAEQRSRRRDYQNRYNREHYAAVKAGQAEPYHGGVEASASGCDCDRCERYRASRRTEPVTPPDDGSVDPSGTAESAGTRTARRQAGQPHQPTHRAQPKRDLAPQERADLRAETDPDRWCLLAQRLVDDGVSQRTIADACGHHETWVSRRLTLHRIRRAADQPL